MARVLPSQVVEVIEAYFPQIKNNPRANFSLDRNYRNECVSIAKLLDQIPAELLNPPTIKDYVELISNIGILNFTLDSWKTPSVTYIDALAGKGQGNPISIIHEILLKCPDQAISIRAAGLEFLDDIVFRESLRIDLSSVNNLLSNGEWKGATILAGAVTEALLLWAIKKELPTRKAEIDKAILKCTIKETDLDKWVLDNLNKVTFESGIIQERTYKQSDLAREFRNYIHPGVEIRKKAKCSIATAHTSIAAVELVIEDLAERFKTP